MGRAEDSGIRVLVAEDNLDVATILEALLNSESDMRCVGCVTEAHAVVPAARDGNAAVLLLDLELNGISGLEVLRACRRDLPSVKVVILTGHTHPALQKEARTAGAADFLIKPDDLEVLADRIRSVSSA